MTVLDALAGWFCHDCSAGRLGRIIFQNVFFSPFLFPCLPDACCAGCLARDTFQCVRLFHSFSPTCCFLLDALAASFSSSMLSFFPFYICLLRGVSCWVPWTDHLQWVCLHSAHGVSSSMSWLNYFGIFVLSFSFIDLPNGVSLAFLVGCLGCVILECVFLQLLALYVCMVACLFLCLRHDLPARCFGEPFFILLCHVCLFNLYICLPLCVLCCLHDLTKGERKNMTFVVPDWLPVWGLCRFFIFYSFLLYCLSWRS